MEPLRGHVDCVNCLTIDGKFLYSGCSDGSVLEWDLSGMAFHHEAPVRRLADCEATVSAMTVITVKKRVSEKRYLCTASYDKLVWFGPPAVPRFSLLYKDCSYRTHSCATDTYKL